MCSVMKSCRRFTNAWASSEAGSPPRSAPKALKISHIASPRARCSSRVRPLDFSSYSLYSLVCPQEALARAAYSSIFFVSNASKFK